MALKQLTVFLENKEGHLNDVLKTLADNDVNIIVAALAESADFGILRMIVPEPEKAREILKNADFSAKLTEVLCVSVPHKAGSLAKTLKVLADANVNVEYMYAFSSGINAAAVIKTKNVNVAILQLRLLLPGFVQGIAAALIQDAGLVFLQHPLQLLFCVHRLVPPHADGPRDVLALQRADGTGKAAV